MLLYIKMIQGLGSSIYLNILFVIVYDQFLLHFSCAFSPFISYYFFCPFCLYIYIYICIKSVLSTCKWVWLHFLRIVGWYYNDLYGVLIAPLFSNLLTFSGAFLDDAMVVSCGHSFGGLMLRKVIDTVSRTISFYWLKLYLIDC